MFLTIAVLIAALAYGRSGQVPGKPATDTMTAREIYDQEKSVIESLPAPSSQSKKSSKTPPSPSSSSRPHVVKTPAEDHETAAQSPQNDRTNSFQKPESAPAAIAAVDHLGLQYRLLLLLDKKRKEFKPVDSESIFHTGDCFALELEPNRDGYVYVLWRLPDGNWKGLFPSPQIPDESEIVKGHTKQRVPVNYCFELDDQKGEEHLYLILSRNPEQVVDLHNAFLKKDEPTEAGVLNADADEFNKEAEALVGEMEVRGFKITKLSDREPGALRDSVFIVPASFERKDAVFADIRIRHE